MPKKVSLISYIALAAVGMLLFTATVLASAGKCSMAESRLVLLALVVLAVFLVVSIVAFSPRGGAYTLGFYLLHTGILFFLLGGAIYTLLGHSVQVAPPNVASLTSEVQTALHANGIEVPNGYYNRIPGRDGEAAELGFNFRVTDFATEYHNGSKTAVKQYRAELEFLDPNGEVRESLRVNRPIYRGNWKIYLMAVSTDPFYGYETVQLLFKKDPGELFSTAGILLTCLGTFVICLCRPSRRREAEK